MISIEVPEMRWLGSRSSLHVTARGPQPPTARQMISTKVPHELISA
jgi:hypothetical protein